MISASSYLQANIWQHTGWKEILGRGYIHQIRRHVVVYGTDEISLTACIFAV